MSLLFCDSFDHYTSPTQKWDATSVSSQAAPVITAAQGRSGAALTMTGTATGNFACQSRVQKNVGTQTTAFVGFAFYFVPTAQLSDNILLSFWDSSTTQVDLRITTTGAMYFTRNGTQIGSNSSSTFANSAYHYVEVQVTINGTTGVAVLKVDGVTWLNLTSQNTQATGNASFTSVVLGPQSVGSSNQQWPTFAARFDDVYICNSSGSTCNTFLGDIKVQSILPTGNGTSTQYTRTVAARAASTAYAVGATILDGNGNLQRCTTAGTSGSGGAPTWSTTLNATTADGTVTFTNVGAAADYLAINETVPDDDSSYLSDSTVTDQSRFTYPAISGASVKAVAVWARARKDDAGTRSIRMVAKSAATVGDNGADLPLSTTYGYVLGALETDPNTSAAWSVAGVNAAEFGVKTAA